MSRNRFATLIAVWAWACRTFLAGVVVCVWYTRPLQAVQRSTPQGLRLYVFDCGYLFNMNPET